jgi:hypothetical protein
MTGLQDVARRPTKLVAKKKPPFSGGWRELCSRDAGEIQGKDKLTTKILHST